MVRAKSKGKRQNAVWGLARYLANSVLLDMSAFKISQFPDDFALALVEFQVVVRVRLRPFMVVLDRLWY